MGAAHAKPAQKNALSTKNIFKGKRISDSDPSVSIFLLFSPLFLNKFIRISSNHRLLRRYKMQKSYQSKKIYIKQLLINKLYLY